MRDDTRGFYEEAVARAAERIVADLDVALDLDALAAAAATSPHHFHRIFRGMVGETPVALSRRLRLERAAEQLRTTELPVTAIAFAAGYETHEAFTRAFRSAYAASPSEFRKLPSASTRLAARNGVHINQMFQFVPFSGGTMDVDIVERPACRLAVVQHVGPYNTIGASFAKLGELAGAAGLFGTHTEMIALYYDDPESVPAAELRSGAALTVTEAAVLPAGLDEARLTGGRYARYVHVGPYDGLGDSWVRLLGQWLPQSGYRIGAGGTFEKYANDPQTTPADQLRTEIYVSIE
ncbi:MAG: GyrI-like domain-containing protein [Acidimicrobiia bacterium]